MARHPKGSRGRQRYKIPNRVYTILSLLIIVLIVVFIYSRGPYGANDNDGEIITNEPVVLDNEPEVNETILPPVQLSQEEATSTETQDLPQPEPEQVEEIVEEKPEESPTLDLAPEPVVVEAGSEVGDLISEATALLSENPAKVIDAREKLNEALRMPMSRQQQTYVKDKLAELSDMWLFNRTVMPGDTLCENYRVKPGDILDSIGKKHQVPYELLMEINNIRNPRALQAGQMIKVVNGPFNVKVYRSTFTMDIYLQNTYVKSFTVGLGREGRETPTGLWRVRSDGKAYATSWRDPDSGRVYQPEDPDYPLGSRWMGLEGLTGQAEGREGFGIHGTKEPDQIGSASSRGCIRMYNGEVIKVYNMLFPGVSRVEVVD